MFDFKIYFNRLVEVYVDDDEVFYIGYIISADSNFCIIKTIDENGCFSSYFLIRLDTILDIDMGTEYLKVMEKLMTNAKRLNIYDPLKLDNISTDLFDNINLLDSVLEKVFESRSLVSLILEESLDIQTGKILFLENGDLYFNSVETLELSPPERIKVKKSEIQGLEFKSVNLLLFENIYEDII